MAVNKLLEKAVTNFRARVVRECVRVCRGELEERALQFNAWLMTRGKASEQECSEPKRSGYPVKGKNA